MKIGFKVLLGTGMVMAVSLCGLMGMMAASSMGKKVSDTQSPSSQCWNLTVNAPLSPDDVRALEVLSAYYEGQSERVSELQALAKAGALTPDQRHALCQRLDQSRQGASASSSGSTPLATAISR